MDLERTVRLAREMADFEVCREIAGSVWGEDSRCSAAQMSVHARYGGVVLIVEEDGEPVGFTFSFPARLGDEWVLWSHETALVDRALHRGAGYALKHRQREIARDMGYGAVAWTFDPLVSRNAHFNLNKLQAVVTDYIANCYGVLEHDPINEGVESDRFVVRWPTDPAAASAPAELFGRDGPPLRTLERTVVVCGEDLAPRLSLPVLDSLSSAQRVYGEIPEDIARLKSDQKDAGPAWVQSFRAAAQALFARGWTVAGFWRDPVKGVGVYEWRRIP